MRLNPRLLFSLLPMFMRAPAKMKILIVIVGVIGFLGWKMLGNSAGGLQAPRQQGQPASYQSNEALPVDDLSIGDALSNPE